MLIAKSILTGCIHNDKKCQYELYKQIYQRFMGMCLRYREDKTNAEISLNNGFVKMLQKLVTLKDFTVFEAWAKRILIHEMLNEIKRDKIERDKIVDINEYKGTVPLSYNHGEQKLNAEYLKTLLKMLPEKTNQVFNLFAIDGYSHKEIADLLNISEGTSKWHVSEARTKLKAALEALHEEQKINVMK